MGEDHGDDLPTSEQFSAIAEAAKKAAMDPSVKDPPTDQGPAPPKKLTETYDSQIEHNMRAFRRMRWIVFWGIGTPCFISLCAFGWMLFSFLRGHRLLQLLSFAPERWGWHVLVFVAVLFALFAIVPMTLGLAIMKMVSNSKDDGRHEVPLPLGQIAKFIHQIFKGASDSH